MSKLKFFKNTFLYAFVILSFTNCSSDDTEDIDSNNVDKPRMTLKIDDIDYEEWVIGSIHSFYWEKRKISDNSYTYVITGLIQKTNDTEYLGEIDFDLGSSIKVNQILEVTNLNTANNYFSMNIILGNKVYDSYDVTTGQLKITHFDGKTISGEFTVNKLQLASFTPQFINITKGVFKNIPLEADL